jgi:hypothetical protein
MDSVIKGDMNTNNMITTARMIKTKTTIIIIVTTSNIIKNRGKSRKTIIMVELHFLTLTNMIEAITISKIMAMMIINIMRDNKIESIVTNTNSQMMSM